MNQKGFTLIETLIVLMIITLILPIVLRQFSVVSEKHQLNGFIGRLRETLDFAQMTAIAQEKYVLVEFNNAENSVDVYLGVNRIKSVEVKEMINFERGTHGLSVKFSPNGSIVGQAGTLFIVTQHFTEKLVILLGQGRFYVQPA